tara:strand:- start:434 stop:826 length:393 start_codon:yes stop_codon:yes gene_type:complete
MIGYSPKFPLLINDKLGAYAINVTLRQVAVQNFKNLLLTSPGERIMDANFGVGLKHYLFEQNTQFLKGEIARRIQDQVEKYMSFLSINSINFNLGVTEPDDGLLLNVSVNFSIPRSGAATVGIGTTTNNL